MEEDTLRVTISHWLDHEFFTLTGEANPALPATEGVADLLEQYDAVLKEHGLSLQNAVRGRLWGKDRESWREGGRRRFEYLSGEARAASSSYISPRHFDSTASAGFDLFAMRPNNAAARKAITDYDTPTNVMRFMKYDGVVIFSGHTHEHGELNEQLDVILGHLSDWLKEAGTGWGKVQRMSCFLRRDVSLDDLKQGIQRVLGADVPSPAEYMLVDDFSTPGKLVEIELIALQ